MFAALSFLAFPTVYFMRCVAIWYMFWPYCMIPAIRIVGQKVAKPPLAPGNSENLSPPPLPV